MSVCIIVKIHMPPYPTIEGRGKSSADKSDVNTITSYLSNYADCRGHVTGHDNLTRIIQNCF